MGILFTNHKLPTIQSESVPRSRSKASTYSYAKKNHPRYFTESYLRHLLFDLRETRKVEFRHSNFHFPGKKVTSKRRKVAVFDLAIVKKLLTFRPHVCLEK